MLVTHIGKNYIELGVDVCLYLKCLHAFNSHKNNETGASIISPVCRLEKCNKKRLS